MLAHVPTHDWYKQARYKKRSVEQTVLYTSNTSLSTNTRIYWKETRSLSNQRVIFIDHKKLKECLSVAEIYVQAPARHFCTGETHTKKYIYIYTKKLSRQGPWVFGHGWAQFPHKQLMRRFTGYHRGWKNSRLQNTSRSLPKEKTVHIQGRRQYLYTTGAMNATITGSI